MVNRDRDGAIDTIYAALDLSAAPITDYGLIEMKFRANGLTDTIMSTNDRLSGYDYDAGTASNDDGYQGTTSYAWEGAMVRLGEGPFRARDGSGQNPSAVGPSGYKNRLDVNIAADTWYHLAIDIDCVNDRSRYYIGPVGAYPQLVPNPDGASGGRIATRITTTTR